MAIKASAKDLQESFFVVSVPYCDLQNLLTFEGPVFYTTGVYGWNSSNYTLKGDRSQILLSTGYRPVKGFYPSSELVKKYESKAASIRNNRNKDTRKALDSLVKKFVDAVISEYLATKEN